MTKEEISKMLVNVNKQMASIRQDVLHAQININDVLKDLVNMDKPNKLAIIEQLQSAGDALSRISGFRSTAGEPTNEE